MKAEFGLIGEKLGHSYSKEIHEALGQYSYDLIELSKEELGEFLLHGSFRGLNVTIPYKKAVIPYCAQLSQRAQRIGSVNTIVRRPDGSLFGDNTDYDGFLRMADTAPVSFEGKKTLIFGSGGTSLTAKAAAEDRGALVQVISRSGEDNYGNLEKHADARILINTTPLGMYPQTDASPVDLTCFPKCEGVLDVVYNPFHTRFLQQAEELGIPHAGGLSMLVMQAVRAAELFTAKKIPEDQFGKIYTKILKKRQNLLLIGMPGSGKTSLGKKLSKELGRPFYDLDYLISQEAGKSIPEIFEQSGEEAFRNLESEILKKTAAYSGAVISTGGGAVLREENRKNIRQNSFVVYIDRDPGLLATRGRPLSTGKAALTRMLQQRRPLYLRCADAVVKNNGNFFAAAEKIREAFYETAGH